MVSVIIPVYNEKSLIKSCLESLSQQTNKSIEILVIDDGSTDGTAKILRDLQSIIPKLSIFTQAHNGPAHARNLGALKAKGEILVFVDADMTFEPHFIDNLIKPIQNEESLGTFTKEEFVSNWENKWAKAWNYNEGIFEKRRIPIDYPDTSPVFRAIVKKEFLKVGGFDSIGFTDDWTLSRKLKYKATVAENAICFHENPGSLVEVFMQARWIGKNEFVSGSLIRKLYNSIKYSIFTRLIKALSLIINTGEIENLVFQLVYGFGINVSIIKSFMGEQKNK